MLRVRRAAALTDARRRRLTGGLDVRSAAIRALFPRGGRAFLLGRERLLALRSAAAWTQVRRHCERSEAALHVDEHLSARLWLLAARATQ